MRPATIPLDARTRWPSARVTSTAVFLIDPAADSHMTGAAILVEDTPDSRFIFRVPWKPTREEIEALDEGSLLWLTVHADSLPQLNLTVDTIEPFPGLTGLCDCHPDARVDVFDHCADGVHCTITDRTCVDDDANRDHHATCCNCHRPLGILAAVVANSHLQVAS